MNSGAAPLRVLLLKPYQPTRVPIVCPPLGLLCLASTLRQTLGAGVDVRVVDLSVEKRRYFEARALLKAFRPHVVGIGALTWEAEEAGQLALLVQREFRGTLVALGGPVAHRNPQQLCALDVYDWIFDGEADWGFPVACQRWFRGDRTVDDIVGLTWRAGPGERYTNNAELLSTRAEQGVGVVDDLDALPLPAWDLIDFDKYAKVGSFTPLKGSRSAPIVTSRRPSSFTSGVDGFGRRWRSPAMVAAEVALLRDLGVNELQILDDTFNIDPARMKAVCEAIAPYRMHIAFPNGLRFDILDVEGCEALVRAGTYGACVAIETVTPRLQELIDRRLDVDRTRQAIHWMSERGVLVRGFFMIGYPTETLEEIEATVSYAVDSDLAQAYFFSVVPQPGTPLHDLATQEAAVVHGVNVRKIVRRAYFRFFVRSPRRWSRLVRMTRWKSLVSDSYSAIRLLLRRQRESQALPESLMAFMQVHTPDDTFVTSAGSAQAVPRPVDALRRASVLTL